METGQKDSEKITDLNYEDIVKGKNHLFKRLKIAFFVYLAIVVCMYFFLQYQKENFILYFLFAILLTTFLFWLPFIPTFNKWKGLEEKIEKHKQRMLLTHELKKILVEEKEIYIIRKIYNIIIDNPVCVIEEEYRKNNIVFSKETTFEKISEGTIFFNQYNQENAREFIKEIVYNIPL